MIRLIHGNGQSGVFVSEFTRRHFIFYFKKFGKVTGRTESAVVSDLSNIVGSINKGFFGAFQAVVFDIFYRCFVCKNFKASEAFAGRYTYGIGYKRDCQVFSEMFVNIHVDLLLYDIKVPFADKSLEYVGQSNELIISNLAKTRKMGKEVILRFPMVPGVNDDEASLKEVVRIAQECDAMRINILPFHQMGASKWEEIGRPYSLEKLEPPSDADIKRAVTIFKTGGLDTCYALGISA